MKFIVSSTALSSHLQAISRVINSKNALPILDCFLFELQDGTLSATVSDSETTMVTTVEVNESDMDGRFAVIMDIRLGHVDHRGCVPHTHALRSLDISGGLGPVISTVCTRFLGRRPWSWTRFLWKYLVR